MPEQNQIDIAEIDIAAELGGKTEDEVRNLAGSTYGVSVARAHTKEQLIEAIVAQQTKQPLPTDYLSVRNSDAQPEHVTEPAAKK